MVYNYFAMAVIMAVSALLLFIFVKKSQVRTAFFAFMLAQLFSWPLTLLYVQFGLQTNPVRLFSHATESNFLFAFIFHPSVFTAYYLHYPKKARKSRRILYSAIAAAIPILFQFLTSLTTDLVFFPHKLVVPGSYFLVFILYNISRIYIDRYLLRLHHPARNE